MDPDNKIQEVNLDENMVLFEDGQVVPIEYWQDEDGDRYDYPIDDLAAVLFRGPGVTEDKYFLVEIFPLLSENIIH